MATRRECELYVVRVMPHVLREDCMTVGVVVVENQPSVVNRQPAVKPEQGHDEKFAEFRITRDWKRLECFAPDLELEIFDHLEATVRDWIKNQKREPRGTQGITGERSGQWPVDGGQQKLEPQRTRRDTKDTGGTLSELLEAKFGGLFEVSPGKGLVTGDPAREMEILERDYLAAMGVDRGRARHGGRVGIVARMQNAFEAAGVLKLLQRDMEMTEFTGENDPFKIDFGFRVGKTLKMFHALALNVSREPAVTLAYRYGRIREGMQVRGDEALLTAVINEEEIGRQPSAISHEESSADGDRRVIRAEGWRNRNREVQSGMAMLRAAEIRVRALSEMGEIAEEVRGEVRG